jgi:hypothetical protein
MQISWVYTALFQEREFKNEMVRGVPYALAMTPNDIDHERTQIEVAEIVGFGLFAASLLIAASVSRSQHC